MSLENKKCKTCRSVSKKLFLKGSRCFTSKCPITKSRGLPGKTKKYGGKISLFKEQWLEKRKILAIYGITFHSLKSYFNSITSEDIGKALESVIESRLDNVVFRCGLASNRTQARQIVNHGMVRVNEKMVTIPSYKIKEGDTISIENSYWEKSKNNIFAARSKNVGWVQMITDNKYKVVHEPYSIEQPSLFNIKLVVEFLSR